MSFAITASVANSVLGYKSASNATKAQAGAAAAANATQRYMYDQTREDTAPFRDNGLAASNRLTEMLGLKGGDNPLLRTFTANDMNADPVYQSGLQFGLNEGTKGINRMEAAQGSMLSGATLKALTRFGNDYGSTKAAEAYNRFTNNQANQYNRLAGLAGSGQTANAQIGAAGQNMANNISENQIGIGNARASGYIAQSNAIQNGINGALSAYRNNQPGSNQLYGGAGITGGGGFGSGAAFGNQDLAENF